MFAVYFVPVMTIAFLAVVPTAMGYITVREYLRAKSGKAVPWYQWIFLPWASVLLAMLVSLAVKWEGLICLVFASPVMLAFSFLGGIFAWVAWRDLGSRSPGRMTACALPLVLLFGESQIPLPIQIRTVHTEVLVRADPAVVWDNIKSVRRIQASELPSSWVGRIGFPAPMAATLSHDGIGGVREASFTGGLIFKETVNRWEPESDLRFSIHANTDSIPPSTLDEHVTIGGTFFDVLEGEYRLEQRSDGVLLHLSSKERISTHFNPYAGQWTDAVMRAIQLQILAVIQKRCEAGSSSGVSDASRSLPVTALQK